MLWVMRPPDLFVIDPVGWIWLDLVGSVETEPSFTISGRGESGSAALPFTAEQGYGKRDGGKAWSSKPSRSRLRALMLMAFIVRCLPARS